MSAAASPHSRPKRSFGSLVSENNWEGLPEQWPQPHERRTRHESMISIQLQKSLNDNQKTAVRRFMQSIEVMDHKVNVKEKAEEDGQTMGAQQSARSRVMTEPEYNGDWIKSPVATMFFGCIICINLVTIGIQADLPTPDADFRDVSYVCWFIIESLFNIAFLVECVLHIRTDGLTYFKRASNLFDFSIVLLGVVDTWIIGIVMAALNGNSLRFIAVFRVLRLLRLLRILRLVRFCDSLLTTIAAILKAFAALGWVMLITVLTCYIVAVILRLTLGVSMYDKLEGEALTTAKLRWGSVPQSMFTLFVCMTGEAWYDITLEAVEVEGWLYVIFLPFMCLANLMLVNVIIGIMCEKISHEQQMQEKKREQAADEDTIESLAAVFCNIDEDSSGEISKGELMDALERDEIREGLHGLDINLATNAKSLIKFFDTSRDGKIGFQEFVSGCMQLKYSGTECAVTFLRDEVRDNADRILQLLDPDGLTRTKTDSGSRVFGAASSEPSASNIAAVVGQVVEEKLKEERRALRNELCADFARLLDNAIVRNAPPWFQNAAQSPQSTTRTSRVRRVQQSTRKVSWWEDSREEFDESSVVQGGSTKVDVETAAASSPPAEPIKLLESTAQWEVIADKKSTDFVATPSKHPRAARTSPSPSSSPRHVAPRSPGRPSASRESATKAGTTPGDEGAVDTDRGPPDLRHERPSGNYRTSSRGAESRYAMSAASSRVPYLPT